MGRVHSEVYRMVRMSCRPGNSCVFAILFLGGIDQDIQPHRRKTTP
jgi:hypothetical protein